MALLRFSHNTAIDFVGLRGLTFFLSGLLIVLTLVGGGLLGFRYGIDFKGGVIMEVRGSQPFEMADVRHDLGRLMKKEVAVQEFGSPRDLLIRFDLPQEGDFQKTIQAVKETLGTHLDYRRIETVGPKVGRELIQSGIWAVALALLAMAIYVWFRFEWPFAVCAFVSLLHDCIGVLAFYIFCRFEFNESAIVALLTTVSYSINDTVVVFDRIREKRKANAGLSAGALINKSLNETLSRTILTSATTLLALLVLYFFGGSVIATFSLPILVGILIGTYSSIFLAAPLLLILPWNVSEPGPQR